MHRLNLHRLWALAALLTSAPLICIASASDFSLDRKDHHAQTQIARLERALSETVSESDRREIQQQLSEVQFALENNHRPSIPAYVDFIEFPILMADALHNPVGKGKTPSSNLSAVTSSDLSRADPITSSFWRRPASIRDADLFVGFDRPAFPTYDIIWDYFGPKKSGRNAGCVVSSGDFRIKVKFAETHSEPFTSRIFHAVGYNVDPTDFCSGLKIKYDRRFFEEFNSRRPMQMRVGMFFIPLLRFNLQDTYDPFTFIDHAILKSGAVIAADELKISLLRQFSRKRADLTGGAFNADFEHKIDYLVTKPANVQIEPPHTHNLGPWAFGGHDHENFRELRGAGVLAAWLGWWDSRFENTRVRIVKTSNGRELRHFWTDLGGGLGRACGTFSHSCENPNDFGWTFTHATRSVGQTHFEINGYEPVEDTPAFAAMTIDDARWMARLIAQLSERQIVDALIASGFKPSEVQIYTEKLLSRRDNLLRDLQLTDEFALLRPNGPALPPFAHTSPPRLLSKSR